MSRDTSSASLPLLRADASRQRLAHRLSTFLVMHPVRGSGLLRKITRKTLLPVAVGPVRFATRFGFDIVIEPVAGEGLERFLYENGVYESGTLEVMRQVLRPGDAFVDVGANIGLMTLTAAARVGDEGRVLACEPDPRTCELLRANVEMNRFGNVAVCEVALGSATGRAMLYAKPALGRGSSSLDGSHQSGGPAREVAVKRLDELVRECGFRSVRMVKIDVEGWEYQVLLGGRRLFSGQDAPVIIIECSRLHRLEGGTIEQMMAHVSAVNGYLLFRLEKGKNVPSRLIPLDPRGPMPEHDNVFCFLPRHLKDSRTGELLASLPIGVM